MGTPTEINGIKVGRIAVLVPCYNEELTIAAVVTAFRDQLPDAEIYVYDNSSADKTAEVALAAGAIVRREPYRGKGNVVRRMFADVEADIYILVDGDNTYDAPSVPLLLKAHVETQADMVNAARVTEIAEAYRPGHRFGNWLLTTLVAKIFGHQFCDILSGYRLFSRRFVKSFPALSQGFEIETELTVHALELRMATAEVVTPYHARPEGSESKLSTFRDGWRILMTIGRLVKEERPLELFSTIFAIGVVIATILAGPVVINFIETGLVERIPTAVLATGVMMVAFLSLTCGVILDSVTRGRQELKRLHYLGLPGPTAQRNGGPEVSS